MSSSFPQDNLFTMVHGCYMVFTVSLTCAFRGASEKQAVNPTMQLARSIDVGA